MYVPVDVIKERLQVHNTYRGGADALMTIWRTEGLLGGIYRGYGATLLSFGPFSACYFMFYERFKSLSMDISKLEQLTLPWLVCSSGAAGAFASFLTSPLDLAKLRLQVQRSQDAAAMGVPSYRGVTDCLVKTFSDGGVRGLFRGAGARVLHFVPATSTSLVCSTILA